MIKSVNQIEIDVLLLFPQLTSIRLKQIVFLLLKIPSNNYVRIIFYYVFFLLLLLF